MRASSQPHSICFGKLPIAGDFLRGDGAAPEFSELDDWIQHGLYDSQQRLGAAWQERFDALPPLRFLWTNGQGPTLAGWWQSSRDSVGRRYPFLLATRLPKVRPADYAALPIALGDYFRNARTLLDSAFTNHSVVSAIEAAQALPCELDLQAARAKLQHELQNASAAAAWTGHPETPELLLHDLEQVSRQRTPPQYSLRWSTRGDAVDMSFWLQAMAKFGQPTPRLMLWHDAKDANSSGGCARAVLCPLEARTLTGTLFFNHDDSEAYDMGRGAADDNRTREARSRFAQTVQADTQANALTSLPQEGR